MRATPGTSMVSLRFRSLSTGPWWRREWRPRSWREYFFCFWSKGTQNPGCYCHPTRPWTFPREPYITAFQSLGQCFLIWKVEISMLVPPIQQTTDWNREARLVTEMLIFLTEFKLVLWQISIHPKPKQRESYVSTCVSVFPKLSSKRLEARKEDTKPPTYWKQGLFSEKLLQSVTLTHSCLPLFLFHVRLIYCQNLSTPQCE